MKRILIVGNANSIWILNFIMYILKDDEKRKIELLCVDEESHAWNDKYADMGVRLIKFPETLIKVRKKPQKTMWERINSLYQCIKFVQRLGEYDIINVQFVSPVHLLYFLGTKGTKNNMILSYWGSDLMRISKDNEIIEKFFLKFKKCAYVTFDNGDLKDIFYRKFDFDKEKSKVIMLSLPVLDWIDKTKPEDCKIIGNQSIPENRIIVAIGYNGRPEQQHLEIVRHLSKLDEKYKKEILILLQMTYGGEEDYVETCERACRDAALEYILFEDFQMYEEIAQIRRRTDIFINAQTTDVFSGSFCEYLYADTVVLNAKWLHYRELDEYPFKYEEFERFEEIPQLMENVIEGITQQGRYEKIGKNKEIIRKLRSNENCKKQWHYIFDMISENNNRNL